MFFSKKRQEEKLKEVREINEQIAKLEKEREKMINNAVSKTKRVTRVLDAHNEDIALNLFFAINSNRENRR